MKLLIKYWKSYFIQKSEIIKIKNFSKKINLNKLNTKQIIQFSLDKTNNKIEEFIYQVSNTQKIYLKRNIKEDTFSEEIVLIKLDKKIIYKENLILQSLYKAATDQEYLQTQLSNLQGYMDFKLISKRH